MNKEEQAKILEYLENISDQPGVSVLIEQLENNPDKFLQIIKANQQFLRGMSGYGEVEITGKTPSEKVAGMFTSYTDLPETYIAEKAAALGMTPDAVKAELAKLQQAKEYKIEQRNKLAEDYRRSQDDSYFNNPWLANEYATKKYREGKTGEAIGEDIWAKTAFATDFMPFPVSVIGPTLRTAQMWKNDDLSLNKIPGILFDYGTSVLGPAKGAAKTAYEGIKQQAGPVAGKLFDTKLAKGIEKGIEQIDREASEQMVKQMDTILDGLGGSTVNYASIHTPREIVEKANEIKDFAPELAEELLTFAKDRNALKEEVVRIYNLKQLYPETSFGTMGEGKMLARIQPEGFADELIEQTPEIIAEVENKLGRDVISEGIRKPATKGQMFAAKGVSVASKPVFKATTSDVYSNKVDNKDIENAYNRAIEELIKENESSWRLGYIPNRNDRNIVYEAWKKWKQNNQLK